MVIFKNAKQQNKEQRTRSIFNQLCSLIFVLCSNHLLGKKYFYSFFLNIPQAFAFSIDYFQKIFPLLSALA